MPNKDTQIRYCFFCRSWERDSGSPQGWVKIGRAEGMTLRDRERVEVLVGNIVRPSKPTQASEPASAEFTGLLPALMQGGPAQ